MNAHDFDRRVQHLLDERRDPLDCTDVCAFLAEHPELLPGFAAMGATLRQLPALAPSPPRARRPLRLLMAATVAAIAVGMLWLRTPEPEPTMRSAILASDLREIRPRAYAAVQYSVRQPLLVDATTMFETYEYRSQRR